MADPRPIMSADSLLICRLNELESRIDRSPTVYNCACISAIIRQILLDSNALMNQANRAHKVPIRFEVQELFDNHMSWVPPQMIEGSVSLFPLDATDNHFRPAALQIITRDQLLKRTILRSGRISVSVHNLIDFLAHNLGGVHYDARVPEHLQSIIATSISVDIPLLQEAIVSIARTVLRGLRPLYDKIAPLPEPPSVLAHWSSTFGSAVRFVPRTWLECMNFNHSFDGNFQIDIICDELSLESGHRTIIEFASSRNRIVSLGTRNGSRVCAEVHLPNKKAMIASWTPKINRIFGVLSMACSWTSDKLVVQLFKDGQPLALAERAILQPNILLDSIRIGEGYQGRTSASITVREIILRRRCIDPAFWKDMVQYAFLKNAH